MASTESQSSSTVGYGQLIRSNRNFRYLWLGQIISLLGDWFTLIASASLVATLTGSGLAIGTLFVVRMLAPFLVSPIAGVIADRYNRKHILITTDITRSITVFCFLFVQDASQVWLLYTLTAIQFGISGFFFPARLAILPDIVSKAELGTANTINSTTWSVMLAFGAAIGGLVSGTWGIYTAFIIDGFTFLLSALFLFQIKLDVISSLATSEKTVKAALEQYLNGLRYLIQHIEILAITLHKPAQTLIIFSSFQIVQVAIAEKVFVIGEGGGVSLGLMFGVTGVGTGIGPILIRYFTGDQPHRLRLALILGYLIAGLGIAIAAPLSSFGMILFGTFLRGAGGGIIWVFSTQLLLQLVPNHVRGRVFATEFALFTLMSAAGAGLAGVAIDPLGISNIIWWMSGLTLVPATLWALWLRYNRSNLSI